MDLAADQYSFNDHAYRRFNETIKDALDPNGILSPGKQGPHGRDRCDPRATARGTERPTSRLARSSSGRRFAAVSRRCDQRGCPWGRRVP